MKTARVNSGIVANADLAALQGECRCLEAERTEEYRQYMPWQYGGPVPRVNPKFCVNPFWGANRAKFIRGGSRLVRRPPYQQNNA